MKYYGKAKQIITEERQVEYIRCDNCGGKIDESNKKYYGVTTGHGDWGNDSCDSVKQYDICGDCLECFFNKYFNNTKKSNTAYFEYDTCIFDSRPNFYGGYDEFDDSLVEEDDSE